MGYLLILSFTQFLIPLDFLPNSLTCDQCLGGSDICAGIGGDGACGGRNSNFGSPNAQAGDIIFNAIETVTIDGEISQVKNNVNSDSIGNSGNVDIQTGSLFVTNSSQIQSQVEGQGNSGKIIINAQDTVSFDGRDSTDTIPSAAFSRVVEGGSGNSGGIEINANSLSITNRAQLSSTLSGPGEAGDIIISTNDEVSLSNSIIISEVSDLGGVGDGGDINITTGSLLLQDGSALLADTENQGDAGNIFIEARERVVLEGEGPGAQSGSLEENFIISSQITSTVDPIELNVSGQGGTIDIKTDSLSIKDGGFIRTSTFGIGNAGKLIIQANDISLDGLDSDGQGSFITSQVNSVAVGEGGQLTIGSKESPVKNLSLADDARISVSTFGEGNAGDLTIFTESLALESGAELQAISFSNGNAGNLTIKALESVKISGTAPDGQSPTGIFASAIDGTGNGGNLTIATYELIVQDRGTIAVGNFQIVFGDRIPLPPGSGAAGNLDIVANSVEVDNGTITARNAGGVGGEITIDTECSTQAKSAVIVDCSSKKVF